VDQLSSTKTWQADDIVIPSASFHSLIYTRIFDCLLFFPLVVDRPEVVSVFPNEVNQLHTTRSWEFLGLERNGQIPADSIWLKARFGEDVIIGNLDTGNLTCV
jgi:hypothetical protein